MHLKETEDKERTVKKKKIAESLNSLVKDGNVHKMHELLNSEIPEIVELTRELLSEKVMDEPSKYPFPEFFNNSCVATTINSYKRQL